MQPDPSHAAIDVSHVRGPQKPKVPRFEMHRRMNLAEELLLRGKREPAIIEAFRETFDLGAWATRRIIERVRERWLNEDEVNRPHKKAMAERRLLNAISLALDAKAPDLKTYVQLERELAAIQGTKAPVRVNVSGNVSAVLATAIGGMTQAEMDELLEEYDQTARLAEHASAARSA